MHPELKRRLLEAQMKVLADWCSEQIWREFEAAVMWGVCPERMRQKDIYDHAAELAYRCRRVR